MIALDLILSGCFHAIAADLSGGLHGTKDTTRLGEGFRQDLIRRRTEQGATNAANVSEDAAFGPEGPNPDFVNTQFGSNKPTGGTFRRKDTRSSSDYHRMVNKQSSGASLLTSSGSKRRKRISGLGKDNTSGSGGTVAKEKLSGE